MSSLTLLKPTHPTPHARGVFVEDEEIPGMVVLRIYNAAGRRILRSEIAIEVWCKETIEAAWEWLERVDPSGDAAVEDVAKLA